MGMAHKFGDDINTDYIIASKHKRDTVDPKKLARFLMEDIQPGFGEKVQPGDFLLKERPSSFPYRSGVCSLVKYLVTKSKGMIVEMIIIEEKAAALPRSSLMIP